MVSADDVQSKEIYKSVESIWFWMVAFGPLRCQRLPSLSKALKISEVQSRSTLLV